MAQTITFDEVSGLAASGSSVERALDKITAALTGLGDAGAEARSVVDSLRKSLQATAAQAARAPGAWPNSTRSTAWPPPRARKHPRPNQAAAKAAAAKAAAAAKPAPTRPPRPRGSRVNLWQGVLQSLRDLWARFWAYLQSYYAPAIAAWQAAWGQMSAVAAAVWEPLRNAALSLWNGTLVPLAQYLATVFLPGVVNSFSEAFGPSSAAPSPPPSPCWGRPSRGWLPW